MVHGEAYILWNAMLSGVSLLLGGKLSGLGTPKKWLLMGCSLLGGVGALAGRYAPMLESAAFLLCPLSVWLCYREEGISACLRTLVTTVCASLLIGGAGGLLQRLGQSPAASLALSALLALLLWTLCVLLPTTLCEVKQVEITYDGRSVLLPAMLDSGNLVRDTLTGRPVIVVPGRALRPLFPEMEGLCALEHMPPGFRLLRVRTAAGSGLWPLFRPDACRVYVNGRAAEVGAMVAIAGSAYGGIQALVPLGAVKLSPAQARTAATEAV